METTRRPSTILPRQNLDMYSLFPKALDINMTDRSIENSNAMQLRLHTLDSQVDFQPIAYGSLESNRLDSRLAGFLRLRAPSCQAVL